MNARKQSALKSAHTLPGENERKYRSMVENATEGTFWATPDRRFLSVNPALARIAGYDSPEEMMKSTVGLERAYVSPERHLEYVMLLDTEGRVSNFECHPTPISGMIPFEYQVVDLVRPQPMALVRNNVEVLAYSYHYLFGLDITVLRYFTVYGPAGRPDMSYFRFIKWIDEGDELILYGDGEQRRDFTYVDDIVDGTIKALKPIGYEIINLGNNHPPILTTPNETRMGTFFP